MDPIQKRLQQQREQQSKQRHRAPKAAIITSFIIILCSICGIGFWVHSMNVKTPHHHHVKVPHYDNNINHHATIHKFKDAFPSQLTGSYMVPVSRSQDSLLYHVTTNVAYLRVFNSNAEEVDKHDEIRDAKDDYKDNYRHLRHKFHGNLNKKSGQKKVLKSRYNHYYDKGVEYLHHQNPKVINRIKNKSKQKANTDLAQDKYMWGQEYHSRHYYIDHAKQSIHNTQHPRNYTVYRLYPKRCNWHYNHAHERVAYIDGKLDALNYNHRDHYHLSKHYSTNHIIIGPFIFSSNSAVPKVYLEHYYGFEFQPGMQHKVGMVAHKWTNISSSDAYRFLSHNHAPSNDLGY